MTHGLPCSPGTYRSRLERLQELLPERGLDGLVVFSGPPHGGGPLAYLTGYSLPDLVALWNGPDPVRAALVLPAHGTGTLVVPAGCDEGTATGIGDIRAGPDLVSEVVEALELHAARPSRWGIAGLDGLRAADYVSFAGALSATALVPVDELVMKQRQTKEPAEIAALEVSAGIASAGLEAALETVVPGANWIQVELAARRGCLEAGAESIHRVQVASRTSARTRRGGDMRRGLLAEGDLVYLRVTGWAKGYGFDSSRVAVVGPPTGEQRDYLDHLHEATDWMIGRLKAGQRVTFYYTESRGREIYPQAHGIGVELVEQPRLRMQRPFTPQQGMVLRVAPVVACESLGRASVSRIVVVEENGARALDSD